MAGVFFFDLIDGKVVKIEKVPGQKDYARSITIKLKSGVKVDLVVEWFGPQWGGESAMTLKNQGSENKDVIVSKDY